MTSAYDPSAWAGRRAKAREEASVKLPGRILELLGAGPLAVPQIAVGLGRQPWDSWVFSALKDLEGRGAIRRVSPEGVRPFVWGLAE